MAKKRHQTDPQLMSFGDHLEELRHRILLSLALPIPLSVLTFLMSEKLIEWLVLPLYRVQKEYDLPYKVQALSPPEILITQIKLSLIAALLLSAPWLLWQVWLFISPGLYQRERRFVYLLIPGSAILTVCGVALMYFVMLPLMLYVLVGIGTGLQIGPDQPPIDPRIQAIIEKADPIELRYQHPVSPEADHLWLLWTDQKLYGSVLDEDGEIQIIQVPPPAESILSQQFHISKYIGFVLILMVGIVIAFQTPLVVLLLGWVGIASPAWLRRNRKYALLICGVVSAIITPADALSMLVMLAPLYGLYELGIVLLRIAPASKVAEGSLFSRKQRKRGDADKPDPDKRATLTEQSGEAAQSEESRSSDEDAK